MMKLNLKSKKKQIGFVVLLICIALVGMSFFFKPGVEVNGIEVTVGTVEKFVEEKGVVRATSAQKIYSKLGGEVVMIHALPGDEVIRGDALAELSTSDSELQLLSMEARRRSLEKSLEALQNPVDSESLKIAQGDINTAKTAMDAAKVDYDNGLTLFSAGALSKDALNQLKMNYDQARVLSVQTQEAYNLLKKGTSKEVVEQTKAELDALDFELQLMASNQESLALLSPMNGTVVDKAIEKGEYLQPAAYTYEIADLRDLYIEVELLVSDMTELAIGSIVEVTLEDTSLKAGGVIARIYPKAFSKLSDLGVEQKRIKLDIVLDQQLDLLYGSEVSVKLYQDRRENAIKVSDSALFKQGELDYVFLVQGDRIVLQAVEVGLKGNKEDVIVGGLVEGQIIVDTPDSKLVPNQKVKVNREEK